MKKLIILLALSSPCLLNSCSIFGDSRSDVVKQKLIAQIAEESKGKLSLVTFTKTNGIEKSISGMQAYEMEYEYVINVDKACWRNGNAIEGYFTNYYVEENFPTDYWEKKEWAHAIHYLKASKIKLKGTAIIVKKEKGWEVEKLTIQ